MLKMMQKYYDHHKKKKNIFLIVVLFILPYQLDRLFTIKKAILYYLPLIYLNFN